MQVRFVENGDGLESRRSLKQKDPCVSRLSLVCVKRFRAGPTDKQLPYLSPRLPRVGRVSWQKYAVAKQVVVSTYLLLL